MDAERARALLLAERGEVLALAGDLAMSFEGIVSAARDSNLDDEHDPEGATIALDRALVASLSQSAQERLGQIDAALRRVADGTYGGCLGCGGTIATDRLRARPTATQCIGCARRR